MKFFRFFRIFFQKNTYIIAKLNDAKLRKTVFNNRLKQFYFRKTIVFEILLKNVNSEFNSFVLKNNQQSIYFNKTKFKYLIDEKNVRSEIKMGISVVLN